MSSQNQERECGSSVNMPVIAFAAEGHRIREHSLVVQLLKGCFNSKPTRARYNKMLDPDVILNYFVSLPDNEGVSLTILSHKLTITKRPHKEVGSSTVARWIKQGLISAGINSDFGAHSTRGSASSEAAQAGVPVNHILKAASWKTDSVFNRFYFRSSHHNEVAKFVLTQSTSNL